MRKLAIGAVILVSIALWIVSLRLPAILFAEYSSTPHNGALLPQISGPTFPHVCLGRTMLLTSLFGPFWLNFAGGANVAWIVGCIQLLRCRERPARIALLIALGLTLQTFQLRLVAFPFDEGGVMKGAFVHPLLGWYVWVASLALPLLLTLVPDTRD